MPQVPSSAMQMSRTEEEVFYVDKHRQAAVVMGERDVKADVKAKKRRDRSNDDGCHFSYFPSAPEEQFCK